MPPTVPNSTPVLSQIHPEDLTDIDPIELEEASCALAGVIADIDHHNIADPGEWAMTGDGPADIATLREAMDQLTNEIRQTRRALTSIERRARRRAIDRAATERGQ